MILMPDDLNSNTFYKKIKEIITFNLGIPCQVLLSETLSKFESNQMMSVLLKRLIAQMGAKLGGAPWYLKDLPFSNRPSAVLGININ